MPQISFVVDDHTAEAISELRREFGAPTNAATIRKALALSLAVLRRRNTNGAITLKVGDEEKEIELI